MKGISLTDPIPPLQGLERVYMHFRIGRCPMLNVFCAYSAAVSVNALKGQTYFKSGHRPAGKPVYYFFKP
jgi:hypothetical protein